MALVLVVGYDDAELLDIACVTTTLAMAAEFLAPNAGYDVRLLTPGGRPVTARPGLRLEAHGALERRAGAVDTLVVVGGHGHRRAAARRGARRPRPAARPGRASGGVGVHRGDGAGRGRVCSTGAGPRRTGRTPTGWPASTPASPSTRIRSSCGTGPSRRRPASPARWTSRCRSSRRTTVADDRATGGPRAGHLHAAAGHAGPDEPARRGARAGARRRARRGRARRPAPGR